MDTLLVWAFVLEGVICGLAWHRRKLLRDVAQLRAQVATLQQTPVEYRVYFAPYDTPEAQERWAGPQIPPGDYRASQRPYDTYGRGYLN